ncbi:hypothetical protein ACQXXB_09990 [Aeromonas veronii]|uniref:hypothetical protein n=1 Tax=Aeromonas veronii TaxID=654 RepID=UPI003D1AB478
MLFTDTDEGDDGVRSVIDTTKVTSSTPADQPLPQSYKEQFEGICSQDRPPQTGQAEEGNPGRTTIPRTKNGLHSTQKWLGAVAKLFGFAIELAGNHQVKPNKNGPLID